MDYSHVFNLRRWRQRFRSEQAVREATEQSGRADDASVDEVGATPPPQGFSGRDLSDKVQNGHGTGVTGGPNWAGWGN